MEMKRTKKEVKVKKKSRWTRKNRRGRVTLRTMISLWRMSSPIETNVI